MNGSKEKQTSKIVDAHRYAAVTYFEINARKEHVCIIKTK